MNSVRTQQFFPWIPCPSCGGMVPVDPQNIIRHLLAETNSCPNCKITLDWWSLTRHAIEDNFMGNGALGFVGAQTTFFLVKLQPNERAVYRLSEHGVPAGARVLYTNYTPQGGGLFPLEFHGNVPTRRFQRDDVVLYPVPFSGDAEAKPTDVAVMVTWIPHGDSDDAWQNLYDAFDAFIAEKYSAVVVPANVAVETSLLTLMASFLEGTVSRKRVDDFLTSAATYSHQLNVLLPVFAQLMELPRLPAEVCGFLNRLRGLRNELAHGGATETPLTKREVADLLAASLFGFHYTRHLLAARGRGDAV